MIRGRTAKKVGGPICRHWIPLVKEEVTNEVFKVLLTDMLPECLERSRGVF